MKKVLALCAVALLAGCDEGTQQNSASVPPVTSNYFHKNTIYFPDGAGLQFSGKLRRYELVENEKGLFDRYTFEFSEDMMAIEGAVFATLAKSGYQRKVRREDDRLYVVNYIKKGFAPVSMTYERMPAKKKVQAFTRLRVVWKNA
ncbi:hypothetical protein LG309_08295 [Stutzerimonas chloritidismutans]|uniref:hypothetical protein n=1 Tax=Stutzerimonas chloritidismutans TaxID=203192 RepID=UPI00384D77D2